MGDFCLILLKLGFTGPFSGETNIFDSWLLLISIHASIFSEFFIQSVASKRNNIPRKSLDYRTPLEVFLSYVSIDDLSNLI